jgi:hypothetical protein
MFYTHGNHIILAQIDDTLDRHLSGPSGKAAEDPLS